MRVLSLVVSMMLVAGTAAAQQDPPPEATGDLAEVMRGILFPNSNILFDAQSTDPGADADENQEAAENEYQQQRKKRAIQRRGGSLLQVHSL